MANTLAEAVAHDRVDFDVLHQRYKPVLNMVDVLIGVVPYCDPYLEIWQPGFRTYNLMVPNFLDLPSGLFGLGAPKDIVGLGMYTSSRAASCAYCSAHTCSYALRRGSSAEAVTGESRSPGEAAAVAVAEALSTDPHHYTPDVGEELRSHYSAEHAEWIVMGVAMMGFLNKFMDAIGVELEQEAVNDVAELIEPTGWSVGQHAWGGASSAALADGTAGAGDAETGARVATLPPRDSMGTMLKVLRNAPGAVKLEKGWTEGVPKDADAQKVLVETYGFDEEIIPHMMHAKPRRALTAMLRHNLDPTQSELGIGLKALVGLVFANHMGNPYLIDRAKQLAEHHSVDAGTLAAADGFFPGSSKAADLDPRTAAALGVARAISPSPAIVDDDTVSAAIEHLTSAEIIEIAVWVSVGQLQHRLSVYYDLA